MTAWWRAWRSQAALEELDPRTLKDIGLAELASRIEESRRWHAAIARLPLS